MIRLFLVVEYLYSLWWVCGAGPLSPGRLTTTAGSVSFPPFAAPPVSTRLTPSGRGGGSSRIIIVVVGIVELVLFTVTVDYDTRI